MELLCFVKEYLASPKHVGGLTPSSRGLAEVVTDAAEVNKADVVVEFGPGTGVFTEVIVGKLKKDARFFALELSEEFVKSVRKRCPDVQVFCDSAANIGKYLEALGEKHCDCIVSGLPFALFEDRLQDEILAATYKALRPGGLFVTFTYVQSPLLPRGRKIQRKLYARFKTVTKTKVVWRNVFPAFAYRAVK